MAWLQLTLESTREGANRLAELLEQFGAVSVSLSAISPERLFAESDNSNEILWEHTRVTALLHEETDLDILLVCLRSRAGADQIRNHRIDLLPEQDWVGNYQQTYGPKIFSDKLCICPSWCVTPENVPQVLMLDPGLAFGTGAHTTTSLCLEWLVERDITGKQIIDYGCGSGILALAALKLGAAHAFAVDIDPQALEAAQANAEKNSLKDRMTIAQPGEVELPPVEILVANVLLNPLLDLAPKFAGLVLPHGWIVLSGLLATQAEECLAAYQSWFNMESPEFRREWCRLQGSRTVPDQT